MMKKNQRHLVTTSHWWRIITFKKKKDLQKSNEPKRRIFLKIYFNLWESSLSSKKKIDNLNYWNENTNVLSSSTDYLEVLLLILPLVCKIDGQYQHQSQNQYSHQNRPGPNYQYQQQPNYTPTRSGDEQSAEWTTRAPATGRPGTTTKRWSHQNFTIDKRFDQLDSVKKFLKYDQEVSHEIEQFSLKLFTHFLLNPDLGVDNFMISPFSIYHILTMILEGSGGSTYQELKSFLHSSDSFKTRDFLQYLNFKLKWVNQIIISTIFNFFLFF